MAGNGHTSATANGSGFSFVNVSEPALANLKWAWPQVLERYTTVQNREDFPWRYSERPLVGMLSAAVWIAGGITLEEYWNQKGEPSEGDKTYGRTDLYFAIAGKHFIGEAKHEYIELNRCTDDWQAACRKNAKESAKRSPCEEGECRVAICFWSITMKTGDTNGGAFSERIETLVDQLAVASQDSLVTACTFPAWAIEQGRSWGEERGYPGLVMEIVSVP